MPEAATTVDVREVTEAARVIDIKGDVTGPSEDALMDAYPRTGDGGERRPQLRRPRVHEQRRHRPPRHTARPGPAPGQRLLAFGLTEHYRQIFELTRLDEAIGIYDTEADALAAAGDP